MMALKDKDTGSSKEQFLALLMTSQCIVDQWTLSHASGFLQAV
jgi:hypothetical protein